jgi:hypothetical protein
MKHAILAVVLIASPAAEKCVVIPQEGPLWNASPEQVSQGIQFPCYMDFYQALQYYLTEVKRQQDEECPRCFPNDKPWSQR